MGMPFQPLPCEGGASAATPCSAPVAVTGLCLEDGTPIAVVTRAADCTSDPEIVGWLDLTTGEFTAGAAPAGASTACAGDDPGGGAAVATLHREVFDGGPAPSIVDLFASYATGPVESVTVTIPSGSTPPQVETASGFSDLFAGESVTWSALGSGQGSDSLAPPFRLHFFAAGQRAAMTWTERS